MSNLGENFHLEMVAVQQMVLNPIHGEEDGHMEGQPDNG